MTFKGPPWLFAVVGALLVGAFLYANLLRPMLARRESPSMQQRQKAIAALCQSRGLAPGTFTLIGSRAVAEVLPASGFQLASMNLGAYLASANVNLPLQVMPGQNDPVFENSFSAPDGSISAADYWRHDKKTWYAFSLLTFPVTGLNLPYIAVTRRDFPGLPLVWGPQQVGLESIDFNVKFVVRSADRRAAVMLIDEGMMQWLLDCDQVSFEIVGDRVAGLVRRGAEPTSQPGFDSRWQRPGQPVQLHSNPQQADPVELELLFKFWDGFVSRVPAILRTEFSAPTS